MIFIGYIIIIVWLAPVVNCCIFCLRFSGSVKTSLLTGSTFNVTWHLGYPHRVSILCAAMLDSELFQNLFYCCFLRVVTKLRFSTNKSDLF